MDTPQTGAILPLASVNSARLLLFYLSLPPRFTAESRISANFTAMVLLAVAFGRFALMLF